FSPSGSSVARKGKPLRVPSTVIIPCEGSFALASFGRIRKVQEPAFAGGAGWPSFAVKRILEVVLLIFTLVSFGNREKLNIVEMVVKDRRVEGLGVPTNPGLRDESARTPEWDSPDLPSPIYYLLCPILEFGL